MVRSKSTPDTLTVSTADRTGAIVSKAVAAGFNLGQPDEHHVRIALDETTTASDVEVLLSAFSIDGVTISEGDMRRAAIKQQPKKTSVNLRKKS